MMHERHDMMPRRRELFCKNQTIRQQTKIEGKKKPHQKQSLQTAFECCDTDTRKLMCKITETNAIVIDKEFCLKLHSKLETERERQRRRVENREKSYAATK